jgi:hypothetical protein
VTGQPPHTGFSPRFCTNYAKDLLGDRYKNVVKIPYGVDLDRYAFIDERKDDGKTVGYVGRVVPWKHLKETVEGAKLAGATVLGSGYIDKPEYFETVDKDGLEWHGGSGRGQMTPSAFKDRLYERMTVFVMYSSGEYESGTLPLLEAMASGVPVMATSQGMARDIIEDGKNGIIFTPENYEHKLKELLADRPLQERLRQEAWKTIKGFSEQQYSLDYQRLYIKTIQEKANPGKPTISIILPTKDRPEQLKNSLLMVERQLYEYKEVIVIDDGSKNPAVDVVINQCKKHLKVPIIHLRTGNQDGHYGLAHARNMGIMEALGDIVVFLDDRLQLEPGALEEIANSPIAPKKFYWGAKMVNGEESTKRSFIENFAWCKRRDIIEAGMFPEWLQMYGGMSQEIRTRLTRQGWSFVYNQKPAVSQQIGSGRHTRKDQIWRSKMLLRRLYD